MWDRATGELELKWVAHAGLVTCLALTQSVLLTAGVGGVAGVEVWRRDTGRHLASAALPVQPEGGAAVQCLLVRDGFCLAAWAGRDCWLWTLQEGGTRLKPLLRLRGHYSAVLCADMDQLGNILTGSRDAQVMRPSCNQHQRPDN